MCESLRPGITVRRFASITVVAGPRRRKMSRSLPVAVIFPSVIARASTNDGMLFVAILALCNIVSANIDSASDPLLLVRSAESRWNHVLGKFRGRSAMNHGVGVLHTD